MRRFATNSPSISFPIAAYSDSSQNGERQGLIRQMLGTLKTFAMQNMPPAMAGTLRAWNNRRMIRAFVPRVVEHVYGTGSLKILLADPLSQGWYDSDWPQLPEIEALKHSRLKPGATVFDVGAHQAVVAMMLAREIGSTGRVIAVEPSRHNTEVAEKNCRLNGLAQVKVVDCAVSDRNGKLVLNEGLNCQIDDGTGAYGRQWVDSVTLDVLAKEHGMPDVVFLDVEGAECMALAGATQVLSSGADFFVEVHIGCGLEQLGSNVQQLLAYFPADRFDVSVRAMADTNFRPLEPDDSIIGDRFFLLANARSDFNGRA